ncbi:MAG: winged helix-turn-helix transcriptional regulator [Maricaulaceae bacterium]|nr:winged helix-turn-helix transcriptional regulator [Maricaulaceae bacterium]
MARARAVDRRLYLLIEIAARRLSRAADARLRETAGVTAAQAAVLFLLIRRGERRMGAIGDTLSLNPPAVTGLVDRMAKAGLVTKATAAGDRRGAVVALTPAGRAAAARADEVLKALNAALEERLGEDAADALHAALTAIAAGEHDET